MRTLGDSTLRWTRPPETMGPRPQPQMRDQLFLNRGGGHMSEVGVMCGVNATDWTWSVRIADLNSDGTPDLAAANNRDGVSVLLNTCL